MGRRVKSRSIHFSVVIRTSLISFFFTLPYVLPPVPVAARSKACVCGLSPAEIVSSNPTGAWVFVCCECCQVRVSATG
jgi:hypothetical protein